MDCKTLIILLAAFLSVSALRGAISVGDGNLTVVFSDDGKLQTVSGLDGLTFTVEPVNLVPFAITVRPGNQGEPITLPDADVEFRGHAQGEDHTTLNYALPKHGLDVALTLRRYAPGVLRWELDLSNPGGVQTWSVNFPRLTQVRIGETHDDDIMIYPQGGVSYIDRHYIRRRSFSAFSGGGLNLGWMDLYDRKNGGLFLADVNPQKKLFSLNIDAEVNRRRSWDMSYTRYLTVPEGETVSSHALMGAHRGTWHAAADIYRQWYYQHFPEAEYPDWAVDNAGWLHRPIHQRNDEPLATFDHYLRDGFDRGRYYGTRFMGVWGNSTDIGAAGLVPYPSVRLGGAESVKRGMDAIGPRGGRATFYVNAYRYSDEYASKPFAGFTSKDALPPDVSFKDGDWVRARSLRNLDGSVYRPGGAPYHDHQRIVRLDHNSQGWQEFMLDAVRRHAEIGVTLYLDESATGATLNYGTIPDPIRPGHENYPLGLLSFLKQAVEIGRQHDPGYILAGERYYELYGPYIAYQTDGRFGGFIEPILYTHPSQLMPLFHRAVPRDLPWVEKFRRHFVRGQPSLFMGESGRQINLLQTATVDLVRYQRGAVYRDDVGLEITGEGKPGLLDPHNNRTTEPIRLARFDSRAEGRNVTTVNFHNYHASPGMGFIADTGHEVHRAFIYTLENMVEAIEVERLDDGRVAVQLPAIHVGTVVLVGEELPERAVRLAAWFDRSAGDHPIAETMPEAIWVGLANLSDAPQRVALSIEAEHGLRVSGPPTVDLAPGEAQRVWLRIENLAQLDRLAEVTITARGGAVEQTATAFVMPKLPNRNFAIATDPGGMPDNWLGPIRQDTEHKTSGAASAKLAWEHRLPMTGRVDPATGEPEPEFFPAGEGELRAVNYLYLKPGRTYRVSCDFRAERFVGRSWAALRVHAVGSMANSNLHDETVLRSPLAGSVLAEARPRPQWYDGQWRRLVTFLTTPDDMEQARVELVQFNSAEPVWFDNLRVEEVSAQGVTLGGLGRVVDDTGAVKTEAWHFACGECGHAVTIDNEVDAAKQRAALPPGRGQGGVCPKCQKAAFFEAEFCPTCRAVYIPATTRNPDDPRANDFCPRCQTYSPTADPG